MHKASMQNNTTAYDACTIITAKMALAVVAANSNVSRDIAALSLQIVVLLLPRSLLLIDKLPTFVLLLQL